MKTPTNLIRDNYPEFTKELDMFRAVFGAIKREHIKCNLAEYGYKLTGAKVNPTVSRKVLTMKELRKKYGVVK